jgi:glycosyltransferase involved in cell wall biosynthesis
MRGDHFTTVWNGIDLDRYAYKRPQPNGAAVIVARLSPEKDIATLLRAVALVVQSAPEFRLNIAGDGPCRVELQQLAASLNLTNQVQFLGEVRDIPSLLGQSSMFVLPSQTEGISLTILEAMARGLPVVATSVGGNPEIVVNAESGLLVPSREPAALAEGILRVWQDPDEAQRMGHIGRARAEEHFNIRKMVASYEALYETAPQLPARRAKDRIPAEHELQTSASGA